MNFFRPDLGGDTLINRKQTIKTSCKNIENPRTKGALFKRAKRRERDSVDKARIFDDPKRKSYCTSDIVAAKLQSWAFCNSEKRENVDENDSSFLKSEHLLTIYTRTVGYILDIIKTHKHPWSPTNIILRWITIFRMFTFKNPLHRFSF